MRFFDDDTVQTRLSANEARVRTNGSSPSRRSVRAKIGGDIDSSSVIHDSVCFAIRQDQYVTRKGSGGGQMNDVVMIEIPVTPEAAEALGDLARRQRVGKLVSSMLRPESLDADPLAPIFASIKGAARADGLTDEDIEAELAAYNAEGRL
jgi:hypothetical protein